MIEDILSYLDKSYCKNKKIPSVRQLVRAFSSIDGHYEERMF